MSKQMKAQDFKDKRRELENQLGRLSKDSRSRFLKLCKANPDVVLYSYHNTPTTIVKVYASDINKDNCEWIEGNSVLEYMEVIEKHLEDKNPRKQLELDLKDQK